MDYSGIPRGGPQIEKDARDAMRLFGEQHVLLNLGYDWLRGTLQRCGWSGASALIVSKEMLYHWKKQQRESNTRYRHSQADPTDKLELDRVENFEGDVCFLSTLPGGHKSARDLLEGVLIDLTNLSYLQVHELKHYCGMFDKLVLRIFEKKIEACTLFEARPTKWLSWINSQRSYISADLSGMDEFNLDYDSLYYPRSHAWLENYWRQHADAIRDTAAKVVHDHFVHPVHGRLPPELRSMIADFYDQQASYRCED